MRERKQKWKKQNHTHFIVYSNYVPDFKIIEIFANSFKT